MQSRQQMTFKAKLFGIYTQYIYTVGSFLVIFILAACKPYPEENSEEQGTIIQICPPFQTALERNLWLALPSHYVAKKLFSNYMNCQGKEIKLSRQEMVDIRPYTYWDNNPQVQAKLINFAKSLDGKTGTVTSEKQSFTFLSSASGGTLGGFTIYFNGQFKSELKPNKSTDQIIHLVGHFRFEDFWNFDPKAEGVRESRGSDSTSESRTRIASRFMSGKGFKVTSETAKGTMKARIVKMQGKTFVDENEVFLTLDNVIPKTLEPAYSPLGLKLMEIVRQYKGKELNFLEIIKILTETCKKTKDLEVKNSCPDSFN